MSIDFFVFHNSSISRGVRFTQKKGINTLLILEYGHRCYIWKMEKFFSWFKDLFVSEILVNFTIIWLYVTIL